MTPFSGELPSEIVSIIKEFSRPLLKYPREYHEAIRELELEDWTELKAGLSGPYADKVLTCLQSYLTTHRLESQAEKEFWTFNGNVHDWGKAIVLESRMYIDLLRLLHLKCC